MNNYRKKLINLIIADMLESDRETTLIYCAYGSKPLKECSVEELEVNVSDRYCSLCPEFVDFIEKGEPEVANGYLRIWINKQKVVNYIEIYNLE